MAQPHPTNTSITIILASENWEQMSTLKLYTTSHNCDVFLVSTMLQLASTLGTYFKVSSNSYAHRALNLMAHPCHTIQDPFSHAQLQITQLKAKNS
jgi:hypothetical protein